MTCCRVQLEGAGAVKGLVPVVAGTGGAVHCVLGKDAAAKRGGGVLQAGRPGVLQGRAQYALMLLAGELASGWGQHPTAVGHGTPESQHTSAASETHGVSKRCIHS